MLANEEVKDGKYVETGEAVERRFMRQWMLKITAYADRLLKDLDEPLDNPARKKEANPGCRQRLAYFGCALTSRRNRRRAIPQASSPGSQARQTRGRMA